MKYHRGAFISLRQLWQLYKKYFNDNVTTCVSVFNNLYYFFQFSGIADFLKYK